MKKNRNKKYFIINKKLNFLYKLRDTTLTLLLWGLWLYIIYPLVALIIWKYFDINIFYNYSISQIENLDVSLNRFLLFSVILVSIISFAIVGWGYYNKQKFSTIKNRRQNRPPPISSAMMAKSLQVTSDAIVACKSAQYIQIYHSVTHPESKEKVFKPTNDLDATCVNLYFSDDWNKIRKSSNFGYTHLIPNQKQKYL